MDKPREKYMTISEASKILGMTKEHLRQLCVEGKIIGAIKFGKAWAIPCPLVDVIPKKRRFHDFLERKRAIDDTHKLLARYDDYTAGEILKEIHIR